MTERQRNLFRASKLIRRIAQVDGMNEFEGALLSDIAWDCSRAAQDLRAAEIQQQILSMHEPDTFSRKVETEERAFRVLDGGAA